MYINSLQLGNLGGGISPAQFFAAYLKTLNWTVTAYAPDDSPLSQTEISQLRAPLTQPTITDTKNRMQRVATLTQAFVTAPVDASIAAKFSGVANVRKRRFEIADQWVNHHGLTWGYVALVAALVVTAGVASAAIAPAAAASGVAAGGVAAGTGAGIAAGAGVAAGAATGFAVTGTLLETVAVTGAAVGVGAGTAAAIAAGALGTAALISAVPGTAIPAAGAPIVSAPPLPGITAFPELTVSGAAPAFGFGQAAPWLVGAGTLVTAAPGGGLVQSPFTGETAQPAGPTSTRQVITDQLKATLKKMAIEQGTDYAVNWYVSQQREKLLAGEEKRLRDELERARAEWAALQNTGVATAARNGDKLPVGLLISLALFALR